MKTPAVLIRKLPVVLALSALTALGGCGGVQARYDTAVETAQTAGLTPGRISAAPFELSIFTRITQPVQPATVYIEGDGFAWLSRQRPSPDPSPKNPLGLRLAARDDGDNIIYLARPCQYTKLTTDGPCPVKYWTSHRFAPEVIAATNAALDTLKQRHGLSGFNMVGFSGGAAVAALITAQRPDVISLRSVAGNLDHEEMGRIHHISSLRGSLNAVDIAHDIADIPQHHFTGGRDSVITPAVYQSYSRAMGVSTCLRHTVQPEATHQDGWVEHWPELLEAPLDCAAD